MIELLLEEIRRKRLLVDLPFGLAAMQARLLSLLPNPPLTPDQVEMLKYDNIVSSGALGVRGARHHADRGRGDPADLSRPLPPRRLVRPRTRSRRDGGCIAIRLDRRGLRS